MGLKFSNFLKLRGIVVEEEQVKIPAVFPVTPPKLDCYQSTFLSKYGSHVEESRPLLKINTKNFKDTSEKQIELKKD
jgi:hypothetical protein